MAMVLKMEKTFFNHCEVDRTRGNISGYLRTQNTTGNVYVECEVQSAKLNAIFNWSSVFQCIAFFLGGILMDYAGVRWTFAVSVAL